MKRSILAIFCLGLFFFATAQSPSVPSWKIATLQHYINKSDSVLVINFWATFCKPCIQELPLIQSISQEFKNKRIALLLVSLDLPEAYPASIDSFAKANKYRAPVVWLNESDADYFCPKIDKSWSGVIPATLFINNKKSYRKFVSHPMDAATFEKELKKAL